MEVLLSNSKALHELNNGLYHGKKSLSFFMWESHFSREKCNSHATNIIETGREGEAWMDTYQLVGLLGGD